MPVLTNMLQNTCIHSLIHSSIHSFINLFIHSLSFMMGKCFAVKAANHRAQCCFQTPGGKTQGGLVWSCLVKLLTLPLYLSISLFLFFSFSHVCILLASMICALAQNEYPTGISYDESHLLPTSCRCFHEWARLVGRRFSLLLPAM